MTDITPLQTKNRGAGRVLRECGAVLCTAVALGVYVFSAQTGYLAGKGMSVVVMAASVLAVLALAGEMLLSRVRASGRIMPDLCLVVAVCAVCASFGALILERISLVADIYFIPVNHPASENVALNLTFVALAFLVISAVALIWEAFSVREIQQ